MFGAAALVANSNPASSNPTPANPFPTAPSGPGVSGPDQVAPLKTVDPTPGETIKLWPGHPPGGKAPGGVEKIVAGRAVMNVIVPRMVMQRPKKPNGAAVLIIGGGGYRRIGIGLESETTGAFLREYGVTTFILYYRLPTEDGWPVAAPFQDAQRAMRLIRSNAERFGLDESQIGIIGYSAGGHLAGMTSMRPDAERYDPIDAADKKSARPDFAGLIYPVLTMMPPYQTKMTTFVLLGRDPTYENATDMSVDQHVTDDAPTTFLAHATDDPIRPGREQPDHVCRAAEGACPGGDARLPLRRPRLQSRPERHGGSGLAEAVPHLGRLRQSLRPGAAAS